MVVQGETTSHYNERTIYDGQKLRLDDLKSSPGGSKYDDVLASINFRGAIWLTRRERLSLYYSQLDGAPHGPRISIVKLSATTRWPVCHVKSYLSSRRDGALACKSYAFSVHPTVERCDSPTHISIICTYW